ncbi:hypothetical protein [Nubsella zeaxanthinifaciens]|uniref:hypothetical protein n=1 Tax=Nubsella zeaxanthinifaciens TaxID=392412 RepID=UPI000DE34AA4|nr:hypothetical protein [Nubsella zeaxanthinifaciens]
MKGLKEIKTNYQDFQNKLPEYLDWVAENIVKSSLTFTLDEIEKVHLYYENNIVKAIDQEYLKQVFIAYMGEAFIKYFGGNWELSTLKKDEAYGTPIINNWGNDGEAHVTISPFVWTEIIRKRGGIDDGGIRTIFERNINRFKTV